MPPDVVEAGAGRVWVSWNMLNEVSAMSRCERRNVVTRGDCTICLFL